MASFRKDILAPLQEAFGADAAGQVEVYHWSLTETSSGGARHEGSVTFSQRDANPKDTEFSGIVVDVTYAYRAGVWEFKEAEKRILRRGKVERKENMEAASPALDEIVAWVRGSFKES